MQPFFEAHPTATTMIRQASLLALVLGLSACANDPAPAPAASEQAEAMDAPGNEAEASDAVEPPAAVVAAFQSGHAGATDLSWSQESDGGYEASFTEGGEHMSVIYTAAGAPGEVETEIAVADLPAAVTATLARDYAGTTVNEAARIVAAGKTTYEAEITENGRPRDLVFQENGTLVESAATETD